MMKKTEQQRQIIDSAEEEAYQNESAISQLRNLVFASIISADNERYTEEVKQEVIKKYSESKDKDWEYILSPLGEDANKYIKLFKQ